MKKSIIIIIGCLLLLGCRQEVLEPEQMIQGMFALDDGSGLTNQYLLFDNGYLDIFSSDVPLPIAGKRIWSYDASLFKRDFKQHRYTISGNKIYTSDGPSGEIELKDDILTIGGKKYSVLEGFERKPYSSIVVDEEVVVPFIGQENSFPYSIENPIPSGKLTVESAADWISFVYIFENEIRFMVRENNSGSDRSAPITLSYTGALDVDVTITQSGKPVLSLTLNKSTLDLLYGTSETLVATVDPADALLQWSTDITSVATVDQTGKVSAKGNGMATITVSATNGKSATCIVTVTTAVTGVSLNKSVLLLEPGGSEALMATVSPATATNKDVVWESGNTSVATVSQDGLVEGKTEGTASITVETVDGGKTSSCTIRVISGAVDLGLSVFWASCNLSESGLCSSPEEYGDYYAWGETSTKSVYNWSSYKWCNGSSLTLTKYCTSSSYGTVDNNTELQRGEKTGESVDDVARAKLAGAWRMPTIAEFAELLNNCTKVWTTYNGKTGYKFTSKKTGYTDRWIFFPAAGTRDYTNLREAGVYGDYWSSSLNTGRPYDAYYLGFDSDSVLYMDINYCYRYFGLSVRPVSD